MPVYEYICNACSETFEKILMISNRKSPEKEPCPKCGEIKVSQGHLTAPTLGDPVRLGLIKPDNGFKEVLQRIHEKTPGSELRDNSNIINF